MLKENLKHFTVRLFDVSSKLQNPVDKQTNWRKCDLLGGGKDVHQSPDLPVGQPEHPEYEP